MIILTAITVPFMPSFSPDVNVTVSPMQKAGRKMVWWLDLIWFSEVLAVHIMYAS